MPLQVGHGHLFCFFLCLLFQIGAVLELVYLTLVLVLQSLYLAEFFLIILKILHVAEGAHPGFHFFLSKCAAVPFSKTFQGVGILSIFSVLIFVLGKLTDVLPFFSFELLCFYYTFNTIELG